jgi:zinc finger protein
MSFVCDHCGFRSNEIKAGGSIPEQGQRLILRTDKLHLGEDLRRDVLKSDTASVYVSHMKLI